MTHSEEELKATCAKLLVEGRSVEALERLQSAGVATSGSVESLLIMADALEQLGRSEEAISQLEANFKRLSDPGLLIRAAGLASSLHDRPTRNRLLQEALALYPDSCAVSAALADAASEDGDIDRSLVFRRQAIALSQSNQVRMEFTTALCSELCALGRPREAWELLRRPPAPVASTLPLDSARLASANYFLPELGANVEETRKQLQLIADDHRCFGNQHATPYAIESRRALTGKKRKLRLGYISPDFRNHSVARFIVPLLRAHDRSAFELYALSTAREPADTTTALIASLVDHFQALPDGDAVLAARRVAECSLDIVIDLAGHTAPHQLEILASRVAPLQLSFLGYPHGTGLSEIDGFITDGVASPASADEFALEPLLRLTHTAWTFDPQVPDLATERSEGEGIVFGAFHNLAKITDGMLNVWSRVLTSVPGAKLAIGFRTKTEEGRSSLEARLVAAGIPLHVVQFYPPIGSREAHLARLRSVDIVLDTFPYAGTTTTCEALWMGVPVVTLAGQSHASRVGASLLSAVGLDSLVATDAQQYIERAVELAEDEPRRLELRSTLRERMRLSHLGNASLFARSIEGLYRAELQRAKAQPGFDLLATGKARRATVDSLSVVLPGTLNDPASFMTVEQGRVDDGELRLALQAVGPAASLVEVFAGAGLSTLAMARAVSAPGTVHLIEPTPTAQLEATLSAVAPTLLRRSKLLPGRGPGARWVGPEQLPVAALDDVVKADAALLRVGGPGAELEVLAGAQRLLKAGAIVMLTRFWQPLDPPLLAYLEACGLTLYSLVPMVSALAKVGRQAQRGVLFALSAAARKRFPGLPVVDELKSNGPLPVASANELLRGPLDKGLSVGISAYLGASDAALPMAERVAFLRAAISEFRRAVEQKPKCIYRRANLSRALLSLGSAAEVGPVLEPMMALIDTVFPEPEEAYLPIVARYDELRERPLDWLRAQLIEAFVKSSAPSTFFHLPAFMSLFSRFEALGFPDAEMARRGSLLRSRAARAS